jgi:hypothetical protein
MITAPSISGFTPHAVNLNVYRPSDAAIGLCKATTNGLSNEEALLDRFWQARGVFDPSHRRQLLDAAQLEQLPNKPGLISMLGPPSTSSTLQEGALMPGIASTWGPMDTSMTALITAVSHRLLALRQLLGGDDDVDIVWMVEREPALLTTDFAHITQRLVELRTAEGSIGVDVVSLVQSQPTLLLEHGSASEGEETAEERRQAWEHGLLGDGDSEWNRRLEQLQAYIQAYGDCHVGFRDQEDASLARWAGKQRQQYKKGALATERAERLQLLGFEFEEEYAEWLRWYNELKVFRDIHGHCNPVPLAAGSGEHDCASDVVSPPNPDVIGICWFQLQSP